MHMGRGPYRVLKGGTRKTRGTRVRRQGFPETLVPACKEEVSAPRGQGPKDGSNEKRVLHAAFSRVRVGFGGGMLRHVSHGQRTADRHPATRGDP